MTRPSVVNTAVESVKVAMTRRALRASLARATAGGTSSGPTTRRRGARKTASLRMGPPGLGWGLWLDIGEPGRGRRPAGQRPRGGGEPIAPLPVVAEHVLAGARRGQDHIPAR